MSLKASLLAGAAAFALTATAARAQDPMTTVTIDSSRHEVIITTGTYNLPNMPPMENHAMMDMGASHDTPLSRFTWPVDGWFRGFRIEALDKAGNPLPRHIMHHMIMVNFDRRQLLYHAVERLMGVGTETEDASIPKSIGVPLKAGTDLGMYVAWHNDTGRDLDDVTLRVVMLYMPTNQNPRPLDALPIYMDVNLTVGGTNTFDVPAGLSTKAWEFTMPISGRLLGVSGHMHDYGVKVVLQDVETGKTLTEVKSTRDAAGKVSKVERKLFGVSGRGLKLEQGRRYRVVGTYDNPTGETIINGAMAEIVGLFTPDDFAEWPRLDPNDPILEKDLVSLRVRGHRAHEGHDMQHMDHDKHD
ncbi:MAG: hypothetical protein AB7I33_12885 [Gemmatimonadales bacterium]